MRIPTLSVGMPVYNGEAHLAEAVESLLTQSFRDFELIISDNASTDRTREICEAYQRRDGRVRYMRQERNAGASDNYNAVFRRAQGKYFKWASSNDYCAPRFFEACVRALDSHPDAVLAFPRTRLFRGTPDQFEDYEDDLDLRQEDPLARLVGVLQHLHFNNVMNGVVRRSVLSRTPLIKPFHSSDSCLMGELALHGKFVQVPEPLFYRRMDEASATALKSAEEVARHYHPQRTSPMRMQHWRINFFYFGAVRRAGLPLATAARLYLELAKRTVWYRRELWSDIAALWQTRATSAAGAS